MGLYWLLLLKHLGLHDKLLLWWRRGCVGGLLFLIHHRKVSLFDHKLLVLLLDWRNVHLLLLLLRLLDTIVCNLIAHNLLINGWLDRNLLILLILLILLDVLICKCSMPLLKFPKLRHKYFLHIVELFLNI